MMTAEAEKASNRRQTQRLLLLLRVGQLHDVGLFKILRTPLPQLREVQQRVEVRRKHRQPALLGLCQTRDACDEGNAKDGSKTKHAASFTCFAPLVSIIVRVSRKVSKRRGTVRIMPGSFFTLAKVLRYMVVAKKA
jgi:hypothetical protein